jgi:phospholipid/cholesterol/gamma-HCH transport system ATP-binding protein
VITLRDVVVAYGHATVLDRVSLHVPEGCLYALVGPAGAGKSTLLRAVTGLVRARAGSIRVGDDEVTATEEIALAAVRRRIGMLFQNYALFDHLTVGENVAFPLRRMFDLPAHEIQTRVAERLARVALPGFENRMPAALSGGQKKRVGIARATVARPPIVLYDEPTAGLDPVTSQKIYDLLRDEQRATGATVIAISSDVRGLLTIADRVGMLHRGRLVFDGTVDDARASREPAVSQFIGGAAEGPL